MFYIDGKFYEFSKRITGIRYVRLVIGTLFLSHILSFDVPVLWYSNDDDDDDDYD